MKHFYLTIVLFISLVGAGFSQTSETGVQGRVVDENNEPIGYATLALFQATDSSLFKAGYTQDNGSFSFPSVETGSYYLSISFIGYDTYATPVFEVTDNNTVTLGELKMSPFATELGEVVVASTRPIVEVKPDKTVFNVEGSINAVGDHALDLLRKAPGVVVDHNENLMLVGKSGVKVYVDGRQLVLTGEDLANYLRSLQASQIDAIEIITQPSSRFEAEGNAGIINIRLIKDKSMGTNATINLGHNQAEHGRSNANVNFNTRTKKVNVFGNLNYAVGVNTNTNIFERTTSDLYTYQVSEGQDDWNNFSGRVGMDISAGENSTVGFLFDGYNNDETWASEIETSIHPDIDSPPSELLEGSNNIESPRENYNFNGNYKFDNRKGTILNIDLDYGLFYNDSESYQPNYYYDPESGELTDTRIFQSDAETDIEIQTGKLDYERTLFGGTVGTGFKLARVYTDNDYKFYNVGTDGDPDLDPERTNRFTYDERVNAVYLNYGKQWEKIGFQAGLRVEVTDSEGDLTSLNPEDSETVKQDYTDYFPSGGLTYQLHQKHALQLNYSRRIGRPNYQDLNPFEFKLDELTFMKGNPFLKPQYSNNFALSHTFNYTLTTTLSYSHTDDLMAQLTDTAGMGAAFLTTENIADQDVYSLNVSYPFTVTKTWNVFATAGVSNTHNKADFGDGKIIDVRATSFNGYAQNTFMLGNDFTFELSGWYNSPGIWGGNFATDAIYSVDAGIQKRFWNNRASLKVSIADIFKSRGWSGENVFGDLAVKASGEWESRQVKFNFTYIVGNKDVKNSRRRSTGLEEESQRIKAGNN